MTGRRITTALVLSAVPGFVGIGASVAAADSGIRFTCSPARLATIKAETPAYLAELQIGPASCCTCPPASSPAISSPVTGSISSRPIAFPTGRSATRGRIRLSGPQPLQRLLQRSPARLQLSGKAQRGVPVAPRRVQRAARCRPYPAAVRAGHRTTGGGAGGPGGWSPTSAFSRYFSPPISHCNRQAEALG